MAASADPQGHLANRRRQASDRRRGRRSRAEQSWRPPPSRRSRRWRSWPDPPRGGPDYPLIVDSGFRRGAEVAIAMALGASAVMLGRSLLYGLAAKGKPGAAAAIEIFRSELDRTLALIGVPAVRKLSSDALSALPA
ncbi:MAG: alpha-hydroxy-acid oxidizing protein [Betaproteobacteria bacterium]|nr:alpha-hydroxy-acid oxidizing protein [Betaproteobacteria bacterium]